ncbi:glycosyltransferase [Microbacterium sp. zg-Y818]|uniref:glycosyltransferase n=1 Tax=unclassified Microbacterium TaxID=2609290 RepID=UPI00214ABAE2|nr:MULTISPECIES: glycosyltransferase [unclassified Microbacterium]MCR2801714.1 glycosyltransferase [Microbacterium sp. zg.Y818]WIM23019.1 glycosyltransferase [Microbacterium sp. zg-Y818]
MVHGRGAIVLAAYRPDAELFRRQLLSLRDQTVADWECIISVDGDPAEVEPVLRAAVGDDARFRLVGDGTRRGFYGNFERGLRQVSEATAWVALCDQDDRWDADKLAALLPHLADVSLVSGQARLTTYPGDAVTGRTDRRDTDAADTVLFNQFTGSFCVFDRAILDTALPFPRASTRVATHDHWLAVVAGAHRGTRVVDTVLQDYVQHASNVYGDPSALGPASLAASVRNVTAQARRYEGSSSAAGIARMTFWTYVGWRQLMVDALRLRTDGVEPQLGELFGHERRFRRLDALLRRALRAGVIPPRFAMEYRASWWAGALVGGRRRALRAAAAQSDDSGS